MLRKERSSAAVPMHSTTTKANSSLEKTRPVTGDPDPLSPVAQPRPLHGAPCPLTSETGDESSDRRRPVGSARHLKPVPRTAHGLQIARILGVRLDLFANP